MIITIDGPVASGKSTVSRMLAQRLGYYYLNSGALYRALGYLLVNRCGYTEQSIAHPTYADIQNCCDAHHFLYQYDAHHQERIFFDGANITPYLKDCFMDKIASIVSVDEQVRKAVTCMQRDIANKHDVVTDGRDVGSVVFPYADAKFFITASVEIRAQRWRKDQEKYGNHISYQQALNLITDRDNRDTYRTIAPLIIPPGAVVIDTSDLTLDQILTTMIEHIKNCSQSGL
jgi:cytidylate kinase